MRRIYVAALAVGLASLGAGWLALGAAGKDRSGVRRAGPVAMHEAELPPLPSKSRARVVQPVAGNARSAPATASDAGLSGTDDAPSAPASSAIRGEHPASGGANAVSHAVALGNGVALPPLEAPEAVKQIIEAGNGIARTPYKWGGGHGKWLDNGYDCSGSVSFTLAAAGLLPGPLDSSHLMAWGEPGKGKWVTIYANGGHVFLEVAGIRFDTSAQRVTGSRWINAPRATDGFVARHPTGL